VDRILIDDLRVMTVIGALPHEREIAQPIRIDLSIGVDLHEAGRSDELNATVHYGLVCERITEMARESKDILLERLAAKVADVVLEFDLVDEVEVKVTKLRPPVPEAVESTAVIITRTRAEAAAPPLVSHTAYIALGSNLGDRERYLRFAVRELGNVVSMSQVFETAPVGGPEDQGAYLNMVVQIETPIDPYALIRRCQRIEANALRQRIVHWGPRTLDVDVLFYDDVNIVSEHLTLPHPRIFERRFVLAPLSEVAPQLCPADWEATLPPSDIYPRGPLNL
jgi:dihydroneopterin aldolase/2-amino-4-hydroxy-6-hydroxymethyldihydropteridine diphosphokinase